MRSLERVCLVALCLAVVFGGSAAWAQDEPVAEGEVYAEEGAIDESQTEMASEEGAMDEAAEGMVEETPEPRPVRPPVRPARPNASRPNPQRRPVRATPPPPRPIRRPTQVRTKQQQRTAQAQAEERNGGTPEEDVAFDFREVPLYDVIETISKLTGRNFDVDPNIGATTVTVITHDKIPPEMAYEVLASILATRGFSMVETLDGHLIKIISTPDAIDSEKPPLNTGSEKPPEGYDNYATHVVPIQYADAAEIQSALQLLGSQNCRVDTYAPTNTLIITDTADGLRRMFTFLEMADVPGFDTIIEIFTLEYTRAEVLSQQLEQVLLDGEGGGPQRPNVQRPQPTRPTRPTRRPVPGAVTQQIIGSREETLRMVPDERLNALIVVANEGMMERVRDLIIRLDTPTPYEANNLHIYELLNADAEQVEQALEPLVGTAPRQAAAKGGGGGGGGPAGEVQPFEQKIQVTRYDQTNALLVVASPQDYKLLEAFIARLDVPQRQVLVEAVVMDVTISENFGLTVDAAGLSGQDGFGMTLTNNIATIAESLQPAADAANAIVAGPQYAGALLGVGSQGTLTAGVFDEISLEIAGNEYEVPFVPVLFQAIESLTDTEVLSQPSLVTVDNEEASIVVGQEVPFITSTASPQRNTGGDVVTGTYGGYTRVQREEVGVKLSVTPQISEGDNVLLDMQVEVSDVANESVGSVDILGPTTNKSNVENRVLVHDGSTAVLAGLIRDIADRSRRQTPILGDLPVLGWLFRKKGTTRDKRNMVVLVTPHIVKEKADLERATQYKVDEYRDANVEELFREGFFKEIFKKHKRRKTFRPTLERTEALSGRRGTTFGKGDIER